MMAHQIEQLLLSPPGRIELDGSLNESRPQQIFELDSTPIFELHGQDTILPTYNLPLLEYSRSYDIDGVEDNTTALSPNDEKTSLIDTQVREDLPEERIDDSTERIAVDITTLSGYDAYLPYVGELQSMQDVPVATANPSGDIQSYYFPHDPDQANWKPITLRLPYLLALATISISFAVIQEYLLRRSNQSNGLMRFENLNSISVPVYFLWRYFPTMVMVLYGLAYQVVDVEAKRLEPYYRLAQRGGATVAQSLNVDGTNFWTWFRPPFPGSARTRLTTVMSFIAVAVVPIVQNASLDVVQPSSGGPFALHMQSGWSRSLTALFGFTGLITIVIIYPMRHSTGLISDPCGIASLLAMTTRSHILGDFLDLDVRSSDHDLGALLSGRRYVLHKGSLWQGEYARRNASVEPTLRPSPEHSFTLPLSQGLPIFVFVLSLLPLVPIFIFTSANIVLQKLPFLMTTLGIAVKLCYALFDTNIRLTEPYYHLVRRNAKSNVLTIDYTGTISFALPFKALRQRHYTLALVATNSVMLEVLTVCLSSFSAKGTNFMHREATAPTLDILDGDAETFRSFWISLILSLTILTSLCATSIFVYMQRRDISLPRKPGSLAFVLLVCHQSQTMIDFIGTEKMSDKEREKYLRSKDLRYGFGWFTGRDGELHLGIDKEPLVAKYEMGGSIKQAVLQANEVVDWEDY
jgi:hypothetical protein